ncbi:MAG: tyrosine-type recombinase/integrase [Candidatus Falkowbacteria bacterium]
MANNKSIIEYKTDYLDYLEIEKGLSAKTQENYSRFLHKFFSWLEAANLSSLKPDRLNDDHIWKYRVFLSRHTDPKTGKTLKKTTQNYYMIALRSLLEFFAEKKITSLSPTIVKLARDKDDKDIKFLTLEQVERLLLAPDLKTKQGLRDRALLESLFSTGLRVAELASLNCDQLKIKNSTEELEVAVVGKGGRVRSVYFSSRAVKWIRAYLDKRTDAEAALFLNHSTKVGDGNTRRLTTKSIERIVKKYVVIAGLPVMATPHTIRHSFATDLLAQGVDLRLVQEFLGHRNIATTQIYTHVTNKQLKDIHKKIHNGGRLKE